MNSFILVVSIWLLLGIGALVYGTVQSSYVPSSSQPLYKVSGITYQDNPDGTFTAIGYDGAVWYPRWEPTERGKIFPRTVEEYIQAVLDNPVGMELAYNKTIMEAKP